jgi:RHS repeat-associated protein
VDGEIKRFLYDTGRDLPRVLEERSSAGALECAYLWGDSLDPLAMERQGQRSYYLTDAVLNVRQLVNASGQITDRYNLDAFGNVLSRTGSTPNQYLLHGQYYDPNAGFYYMRARWMNPELGGFTSLDPVFGDPMNPISLHKYLFAAGNPLTYIDPKGESTGAIITEALVIAMIGVFVAVVALLLGLVHLMIGLVVGFIKWQGGTATLTGSIGFIGLGGAYVNLESECWAPHNVKEKKIGKGEFILFFLGVDAGIIPFGFNLSDLSMHSPVYWGNYPPVPLSGVAMLGGFTMAGGYGYSASIFIMGSAILGLDSILVLDSVPTLHGKSGAGGVFGLGFNFLGGISMPCYWEHNDC